MADKATQTTAPAHTPGPWRTDTIGADRVWILDGQSNYLAEIVAKDECGFVAPTDQQQANASLMSAAPEMYEMLRVLNERLDDPEIDTLIAKAEGRSDEPKAGEFCPTCGDILAAGHSCEA